jgi:hypothetical protein
MRIDTNDKEKTMPSSVHGVTPIDDRLAPDVLAGRHLYYERPRDEHLVED